MICSFKLEKQLNAKSEDSEKVCFCTLKPIFKGRIRSKLKGYELCDSKECTIGEFPKAQVKKLKKLSLGKDDILLIGVSEFMTQSQVDYIRDLFEESLQEYASIIVFPTGERSIKDISVVKIRDAVAIDTKEIKVEVNI